MPDRTPPSPERLEELAALVALGGPDALDEDDRALLADHGDDPVFRRALDDFGALVSVLPAHDPSQDPTEDEAMAHPPDDLRRRVIAAVASERGPGPVVRWLPMLAAAAVAVVLGVAIGRTTVPTPPAPPVETVALASDALGTGTAGVIAHTWGTELLFTFDATTTGENYTVTVTAADGTELAAGSFIGDAERVVDCEMNVAVLRADAAAFTITDGTGSTVVEGDLPPLVALGS
jgi:hypothetical protein